MGKRSGRARFEPTAWMLEAATVRRKAGSGGKHRPFVVERDGERHLLFNHDSVQSTMSMSEPDALTAEYTRRMMAFLLFNPDPREILMIGLGGGSLAKFCYRHLPRARITAVEIDADVIALRDEFMVPFDDDRFRVIHADGARYLATHDISPEVIIVDAFDHEGVAPSLATSDFYPRAAACLAPSGIFVMNLSGEPARYDIHLQRIHDAFGERTALLQVGSGDNELLFAYRSDMVSADRAATLQAQLSLDFPRYAQMLAKAMMSR
jgi:spermidine synthase